LLRITSGDLGTKAGEAEKKIQEAFRLASAWKAILLLDEADVFLAKRATGDITRNAFVTVFLCSMEYYAGILMLTTNQRDAFDEAFQSRIHLQIPYPPLDVEQRKAIWANVIKDQDVEHDLDEQAFARLSKKVVRNGREIKNLVMLALLIAEDRGVCLNEEIITMVCDMDCRDVASRSGSC
jgi:SpoVK/Ycf46/Vps4 family AAA+-type ATPase